MDRISFSIQNDIAELRKMQDRLDRLAEEWQLAPKTAMHLNLVMEEVVSNIIFYAYDDDHDHEIRFEICREGDELRISIRDDGREFNPLTGEEFRDKHAPAEKRKIGGLGIHFVKELMDEMAYTRENEENILYLVKKL